MSGVEIYKLDKYIKDYTINTPLRIRYNNNLISKIIHNLILLSINKKKNKSICCFASKNTPTLIFLSPTFNNVEVVDLINKLRSKLRIIDYVFKNKYFNEMTIDNDYYVSNINDKEFTFITEEMINQKHKIIKKNVNVECINTINVKNKYDVYYDIFEKNGKKYVFSLELIAIWYSKIKDTAKIIYNEEQGTYKTTDFLLYNFICFIGSMFKELTNKNNFEECINNVVIHGIYKISVKELNKKIIKHTNKITYTKEDNKIDLDKIDNLDIKNINNRIDCKVSTYEQKTATFNNNDRHRYSFFINPLYKNKTINDDELIKLFECNKGKKPRVSKNKVISPIKPLSQDIPPPHYDSDSSSDDITNDTINDLNTNHKTPLNISYHPTIINKEQIYNLLFDLIYKNNRFETEYNKYGFIYVFKDFDKDYTLQKYINFKFENDGYFKEMGRETQKYKQSKTYHAYLTKDLLEIKSLSYIEKIEL